MSSCTIYASKLLNCVNQKDAITIVSPTIFYQYFDQLFENGILTIIDDISSKNEYLSNGILHWKHHLIAVGCRSGFLLIENDERTQQVSMSNSAYQVLLRFKKTKSLRWRVYTMMSSDAEQVAILFNNTFHEAMSPSLWNWKYGDERGYGVLVKRDGTLVGHYGGMTRPIHYFGNPQLACQVGDVMVSPSERGVLTKKGPFFLAASTFLEKNIGYTNKHLLGFGFPNHRAMKMAQRLGLYGDVGKMVEIQWDTTTVNRVKGSASPLLASNSERIINKAWQAMKHDFNNAVLGVRDWTFVQHRYLAHPNKKYDIYVVQSTLLRRQLGIMILQKHEKRGVCELMDLICPLSSVPTMVDHARILAASWGLLTVSCWITEQYSTIFGNKGSTTALDIHIPCNIWTKGPSEEMMHNKWWLMSGDTDFR